MPPEKYDPAPSDLAKMMVEANRLQDARLALARSQPMPDASGSFGYPRCVSIINILDVAEHSIIEYAGTRSHYIRFVDGSKVWYGYNQSGELLNFTVHRAYVDRTDPQHYWIGRSRS